MDNNLIAQIAQLDVQVNGPIPDNARDAYFRGITATLNLIDAMDRETGKR